MRGMSQRIMAIAFTGCSLPATSLAKTSFTSPICTSTTAPFEPSSRKSRATLKMTATKATAVRASPEQVVLSPLPRVYQYDHCPYCVRVRYALGVKNVKHELIWLHNDDVATPTAMVGKKVVPIFAPNGGAVEGPFVRESLDIVSAVDSDAKYGPTGTFKAASGRTDISGWFSSNVEQIRRLTRPRVVDAYLPEFATADARAAFVKNHALPEPSDYATNLANTKQHLAVIQEKMAQLDEMIYSAEFCTEGGLSVDDIDLFPRLRTLSLVKDIEWPEKTLAYMNYHSKLSDIGLYFVFSS